MRLNSDEIKRTHEWGWASVLHYTSGEFVFTNSFYSTLTRVNYPFSLPQSAEDDPPTKCFRPQDLVCPNIGCIIDAVVNYTMLLHPASGSPPNVQQYSVKFLTHFLGDLHQPLHISSKSRGANEEKVTFGKKFTNLHSV
jgi:hypothetical protein